jgi:hypothetical protein
MDPTKEQDQVLCKSRKKVTETLAMIIQAFGEESMSRTWKAQNYRNRKKGETGEKQSQEHAHDFL